jgi:hypothetical protein
LETSARLRINLQTFWRRQVKAFGRFYLLVQLGTEILRTLVILLLPATPSSSVRNDWWAENLVTADEVTPLIAASDERIDFVRVHEHKEGILPPRVFSFHDILSITTKN